MRGVVTIVWFAGVMAVGAIAGVELARYRQSELIREAQTRAQAAAKPAPAVAEPTPPIRPAPPPAHAAAEEALPPEVRPKPPVRMAEAGLPPQRPPSRKSPEPAPAIPPPPVPVTPAAPATVTAEAQTEAPAPAPAEAPKGRVRIVISLPTQRAYVFKDGELWDSSRVSTGKKGKRTPVGTNTILEKARYHRSNKYSNAPMPYMQRITWGGVALHAGYVPGYPASHGCIRLPSSFAKRLYKITNFSSVVVVTDKPIDSAKEAREGF
jgi:lipoprotein-anchoring transpeptidase ErfK/SrfK